VRHHPFVKSPCNKRRRAATIAIVAAWVTTLPGCVVDDIHSELVETNDRLKKLDVQIDTRLQELERTNDGIEQTSEQITRANEQLNALRERLEQLETINTKLGSIDSSLQKLDQHLASLRKTLRNIDSTIPFLKFADEEEENGEFAPEGGDAAPPAPTPPADTSGESPQTRPSTPSPSPDGP